MNVYVGLSGGVDSAVTAAILQKSGASVTGVFIKGWYPPGMPCTWADDRRDAMRVAARLGIPFKTLDAQAEYKKGVIDYLLSEYAAGRTPNPDVMCNREVKFGAFYNFARNEGAEVLATGHYARSVESEGGRSLLRGVDESKDQSYFLWAISPKALNKTLFPLGDLHKTDVRRAAHSFNLPVSEKKDSQGICFLGSISVDEFLRKELSPEPGLAVDESGNEIGQHDGSVLYTLGERIALRPLTRMTIEAGPWYVQKKNMHTNVLTVSRTLHNPLGSTSLKLRETNWFGSFSKAEKIERVTAQYRYHGPRIPGVLYPSDSVFIPNLELNESVASGQSLVLYEGERCIGGGIIC